MKIEVNGETKFDNMLDENEWNIFQVHKREKKDLEKKKKQLDQLKVVEIGEDQVDDRDKLTKEILEIEENLDVLKFNQEPLLIELYKYQLPSLLNKIVKTMYKDEIGSVKTNRVDKMTNNFSQDIVKKEWFRDDIENEIVVTIHLEDFDQPAAFYKTPVREKYERLLNYKAVATLFFKKDEFKKACKMYQKINGYFNFGDANNNFLKEDEEDSDFKNYHQLLWELREPCFMNVAICKYKVKQFESIIDITNQVLDFNSKCLKAWYFRGKAFFEMQDYDEAVEAFKEALKVDPDHKPSKQEYEKAKKVRADHIEREENKYKKIFGT